jgi:dTDP-4-dehydrorhamnose reductase
LAVNVHGLDILSRISSEIGAQIVQFSTWAVFDNNGKREKTEKSATKPKSFYGKSKLKAEHICCKNNKNSLIIRPGWVFGFDTTGLINDWIYNAQRRLKVKVRSGMIGSPTYAEDLAEATYELIDKKATGIYNISNTKSSSYGFLARTTMKLCNLNPDLVIEIGEQCFKAKLPCNSVLSCLKYNNTIGQEIRSWEDALKEGLFKTKRFFP